MNTITTTASNHTILAIDLGKYKCVACILDPKSGEFRFTTDRGHIAAPWPPATHLPCSRRTQPGATRRVEVLCSLEICYDAPRIAKMD